MTAALLATLLLAADPGAALGHAAPAGTAVRLGTIPLSANHRAAIQLSRDGKRLISFSDGEVRDWDLVSRRLLRRKRLPGVPQRFEQFIAYDVSPDGDTAAVMVDRSFYLYDTTTGEQRGRFPTGNYYPLLEFSPDGTTLALEWGDQDGWSVLLWDVEKNRLRQVLKAGVLGLQRVAFTPDSKRLAGFDRKVGLRLWDVATGEELRKKLGQRSSEKEHGKALVFSHDGRLLAAEVWRARDDVSPGTSELGGLLLIETASGEEIVRLEMSNFDCVAFTPDDRGVVVTDKKGLRVWDTTTGEPLHQMDWPEGMRDADGEAVSVFLTTLPGNRMVTVVPGERDLLTWSMALAIRPAPPLAGDVREVALNALWADLAGEPRRAYRAVHDLSAAPSRAVPFLRRQLLPMTEDGERVLQLLADLDSDSFALRGRAFRELARMRDRVEPLLRRTLESKPSLDLRRRIELLLAGPGWHSAEDLRVRRAIHALERSATPEARNLLRNLADCVELRETHEAKASLERLRRSTH